LAKHLAAEEPDISTVSISPGRTDTEMQAELRKLGQGTMAENIHADFVKAFEDGKLNKPELPAQVIAQLAVAAKPDISGQFLSWNAPELESYRE
jgi:NAD(P)-dependent dehydrogenase (short-subunit alcohol dehydrogenase family)